MNLKSGISKDLKKKFILDEDALIRIKGVLDKAAKSLEEEVQVVFYIHREDDRFYETFDLEDVISDPNIIGKKITLLRVEMRQEKSESHIKRDWIARVEFLAEMKWGMRYVDNDEIHIDISTSDRNWALLLADDLEPQVERTIIRNKLPTWPLIGAAVLFLYVLSKILILLKALIPKENMGALEPALTMVGFISLSMFIIVITIYFPSFFSGGRSKLSKFLGSESVFLWGDEEKNFRERESTRKNIYWGGIVAFIVSVIASVVITVII